MATLTALPPSPVTAESNPANELAQAIIGRPYLSWSSVSTWLGCPMKFRLQYVDRVPPAFTPSSLAFGSALHGAISFHFEELFAGQPAPTRDQLLVEFWTHFKEQPVEVRFRDGEDLESIGAQADRMLTAFQASPHSRPAGILLAVEDQFTGPTTPGCPDLLARLDLVQLTANGLVVTDWKTSKTSWTAEQLRDHAGQLLLYAQLAASRLGEADLPVQLNITVLTKHKTPRIEVHAIEHDPAAVDRTLSTLADVWAGITAGVFPARPGWPCKQCAYRPACPAMAHSQAA